MTMKRRTEDDNESAGPKSEPSRKAVRFADTARLEDNSNDSAAASAEEALPDKSYHTIESDEEDEYEAVQRHKSQRLNVERDVDGLEETGVQRDGDIRITPFNLKEEEEDGHFDRDGSFVWKKASHKQKRIDNGSDDDDDADDPWLDSVNWAAVSDEKNKTLEDEEERKRSRTSDDAMADTFDELAAMKRLLSLMQPRESVTKALQRLGKQADGGGSKSAKRLTTAEKWKIKKAQRLRQQAGEDVEMTDSSAEDAKSQARSTMNNLSSVADEILRRTGRMDVYELTHEALSFQIKQKEREFEARKPAKIDQKVNETEKESTADLINDLEDDEEPVFWEYKLTDAADAEVRGPHDSQTMLDWKDAGEKFANGGFVRQVGTSTFFDVKRIDFTLYT